MERRIIVRLCTVIVFAGISIWSGIGQNAAEAPAGFDTPVDNSASQAQGNGMVLAQNESFTDDMKTFMEEDDIAGGLGPVYNARGCVDCHANPVVGGGSIVSELRVGHHDAHGNFVNPTITLNDGSTAIANRSLVNDRAICAQAQERVPRSESIRALRATTSTLIVGASAHSSEPTPKAATAMRNGVRRPERSFQAPPIDRPTTCARMKAEATQA